MARDTRNHHQTKLTHSNVRIKRQRNTRITAEHALDVIQSGWAVLKTISSPIEPEIKNYSWNLIIKQLKNPGKKRYVKPLKGNIDRERIFDPQKQLWNKRSIKKPRGLDKETEFMDKTALSLIPPNGMMKVFEPRYGTPIALLFDWRLCDRKDDRYVFPQNIVSDNKPWLWHNDAIKQKPPIGIALSALQEKLQQLKPGDCAKQNELLGGITQNAIIGIMTPKNTLLMRFNAQSKKRLIQKELQLDLPIFIFDLKYGMIEYTVEMQKRDLDAILSEIEQNPYPPHIKAEAVSCLWEISKVTNRQVTNDNNQILDTEITYPVSSRPTMAAPTYQKPKGNELGGLPRDIRRYILSFISFSELVISYREFTSKQDSELLTLKDDFSWVIENIGITLLKNLGVVQASNQGYLDQLQSNGSILIDKLNTELKKYKPNENIAIDLIAHLVLSGSFVSEINTTVLSLLDEIDAKVINYWIQLDLLELEGFRFFFTYSSKLWSLLRILIINESETDCLNIIKYMDGGMFKWCSKTYVEKQYYFGEEIKYKDYVSGNDNILTLALMHQTLKIINVIIYHWPESVALTIDTLQKLVKFTETHDINSEKYRIHYDPIEVTKALKRLFRIELPQTASLYKDVTSDTKEMLLSSIQEDIDAVDDWESLYKIYQNFIDSPILSIRRHGVWDSSVSKLSFWGTNKAKQLYTQSIIRFILKLQVKTVEIINQENASRELISEILCSDLFSAEHFQRGVPEDHLRTIQSIDLNIQNNI